MHTNWSQWREVYQPTVDFPWLNSTQAPIPVNCLFPVPLSPALTGRRRVHRSISEKGHSHHCAQWLPGLPLGRAGCVSPGDVTHEFLPQLPNTDLPVPSLPSAGSDRAHRLSRCVPFLALATHPHRKALTHQTQAAQGTQAVHRALVIYATAGLRLAHTCLASQAYGWVVQECGNNPWLLSNFGLHARPGPPASALVTLTFLRTPL